MITLQILDAILNILSNKPENKMYLRVIQVNLYQNYLFKGYLTDLIIEKSIEKLLFEKYITEIKIPFKNELFKIDSELISYEITWEGQFFLSQGGYGKYQREYYEKERVVNLENEQLANAHKINELQKGVLLVTKVLAWLTGVASVYYLIEIANFANSFFHFWAVKK